MSQDDGSDSEPELVVQSKGHWEKNLGVRSLYRIDPFSIAPTLWRQSIWNLDGIFLQGEPFGKAVSTVPTFLETLLLGITLMVFAAW